MADITDKQLLKLYREVVKVQGETISKVRADFKDWKALCEKKGWTVSRVLQEIDHDCYVCQTRCLVRAAEVKRLREGLPHETQETLKSLNLVD